MFKNSARTAKKTPHLTVTKINWLTLFKEIIAGYSQNHMKHTIWGEKRTVTTKNSVL
jgi:hypothetical protein